MAHLIVLYNPLDTTRRRIHDIEEGTELGAWLAEHEPVRGSLQQFVYVHGKAIEAEGYRVEVGDQILVVHRPGQWALVYIAQALIAAAISYALNLIFGPKRPSAGNTPSPSQVYGIAPPKNTARLGEPIPVAYGSVLTLPDYAAQPYTEYENNEQYLKALLCIGQGDYDVHAMLVGDSDSSALPPEVVRYEIFSPAAHASTFGVIQEATGVRENVSTSVDVADQELLAPNETSNQTPSTWYWALTAQEAHNGFPPSPPAYDLTGAWDLTTQLAILPDDPPFGTTVQAVMYQLNVDPEIWQLNTFVSTPYVPGDPVPAGSLIPPPGSTTIGITKWVGPFETCKPGQAGRSIELDLVFIGGLAIMDSGGNLGDRAITVRVEYTPIDDSGADIGPTVGYDESFLGKTNTALRFTRKRVVPLGRYRVRASRSTDSDGRAGTLDRVHWTGLKFELDELIVLPVYGDVTMAAVTLRASNGIASDAASSIRFRVTRKLAPLGVGATAATVNPADAFVDILTAAYGGNRPVNNEELDLPLLATLRAKWAYHNGFNAVFDQPSTVWEALTLSVQTVSAAPLPVGSRMSVIEDAPQPVRVQLFTDVNTVAGSLQVTHQWDRAGTPAGARVEFRDPRTFSADAVFEPVNAPDYQSMTLFGCTSREVAEQHANLIMDRRQLQRTTATFATELEGLNCLPGQRIGIQSRTMRWGAAAWVVRAEGLALQLSVPMDWTGGPHAVLLRDPRGQPHTVVGVTQGARADILVLPGAAPFAIRDSRSPSEPTHLAFGVVGTEVTDWTVQRMAPSGTTVTIEAINYAPSVWDRAAPHQGGA